MSRVLPTVVIVVLLALLGERAWAAYQWKALADRRGAYAEAAAAYLFAESEVKVDGKKLNRAQLLDLFLVEILKNSTK